MHNYSCVRNFAKSTYNKLFFAQLIWAQLSCDHNFGLMTKAGAGQGKRVEKEAGVVPRLKHTLTNISNFHSPYPFKIPKYPSLRLRQTTLHV